MATSSPLSLTELLAPLRPSELREEHWGRAALHLPGTPARIAGWRHDRGWRAWALRDVHAASLDAEGIQQRRSIEVEQLDRWLAEGHTVCGDASDDPRLHRVLADLGANLGASRDRPFAKLYVSPSGRGYALHADRYHVLVVQLSGRKRWWFGERPAVPWAMAGAEVTTAGQAVLTHPYEGMPMRDDEGSPIAPPRDDQLRTVVLSPGHCLYLPPGTWHRTEALSTSVALSLSPPRTPLVELFMDTVTRALMHEPEWRADLGGDDVAAVLEARVRELHARIDAIASPESLRQWVARHEERLAALAPPRGSESIALGPADRLERSGERPLRWVVAPGDEGSGEVVFFYGGGQEWSLPLVARPLVEGLASVPRFRVEQALAWAPELEQAEVVDVLTELLRAGMLRRLVDQPAG